MALTQKEQIAVGIATTLIIVIAFVVIWRMDQREKRLMTFATWEACMINDIYQNTSNGGAVDKGEYNKIADRCRKVDISMVGTETITKIRSEAQ